MLTTTRAPDDANVRSHHLPPAISRRAAIRERASRHGLEAVRWWPPNDGDLLVEGLPVRLRQLRADLERTLGCKVAIYLADCLAGETLDRLRRETIDLLELDGPARDASSEAHHQGCIISELALADREC
jgi:hypothetical protein